MYYMKYIPTPYSVCANLDIRLYYILFINNITNLSNSTTKYKYDKQVLRQLNSVFNKILLMGRSFHIEM